MWTHPLHTHNPHTSHPHPHIPFLLFHKYKQSNRLYIFYLQIYICLESVGYGAKGLRPNPQ